MKKLMMIMLGLAFLTGTVAVAQDQKEEPKKESKKKKAPKKAKEPKQEEKK